VGRQPLNQSGKKLFRRKLFWLNPVGLEAGTKLCDLTQFYSPHGGGVKRYLLEKVAYIDRMGTDDHVVIIPGSRTECIRQGRSRIYTIRSPRSGYGARQAGAEDAEKRKQRLANKSDYML